MSFNCHKFICRLIILTDSVPLAIITSHLVTIKILFMDHHPYVFLLGGRDLEMITIKRMLIDSGFEEPESIADLNLQWGAKLSTYQNRFNDELTFVGIELSQDIVPPPHYINIDHHNENANKPSSIEQIAKLLGIELTREQQLIAANDKGFIPAMEALGATREEIADIRRRDREAQGVTEEDERLGEKSIRKFRKQKGEITLVKSLTSKFSTITDRLYPCDQLIVYTDNELNYFGRETNRLNEAFAQLINENKAYSGGTSNGFFGLTKEGIDSLGGIKPARKKVLEILSPPKTASDIDAKQSTVEQRLPGNKPLYSYHIFIFPFKWDAEKTRDKPFSEKFNLKDVKNKENSSWINLPSPITPEYATELYNEKNFFYEFVHPVLYDEGAHDDSVVLHYERKEAYDNRTLTYEIDVIADQGNRYRLHLKSIGLNLYSTGSGSLVFYLENHDYPELEHVLRINQFGRRIFPPFMDKTTGVLGCKYAELANHIAISGLNGGEHRYFEDFTNYTDKTDWKAARFIESLINDFNEELEIKPVTDDRMHVLCWYGNDEMSKQVKGKWLKTGRFKKDWYRLLFVDGGNDPMCQNKELMDQLIKDNTYFRWTNWGSIHGISRYSFIYLTNTNPDFLLTHFRTIYTRMVELSLIQRASILKFSDEVTRLSKLKSEKSKNITKDISGLYKAYIRFVNQIYFREVTAQEQGIELYNLLQEKMKIAEQVKDLDNEIEELHNYANLLEQKEQDRRITKITILGAIFLPATFLVGLFGINTMPDFDNMPDLLFNGKVYWPFWIGLGTILVLAVLLIILIDLIGRFGILFKPKKKS